MLNIIDASGKFTIFTLFYMTLILNILEFLVSHLCIAACQTTPKLSGLEKPPFYYTSLFCGLGI